jgi:hypothetical protein
MSGRELVSILAVIVAATAVAPPLAAWTLNRWRVDRAASHVQSIAAYLRSEDGRRGLPTAIEVVCGTGRLPKAAPAGNDWVRSPTALQDVFGPARPRDPWGRCYVANIGGRDAGVPVLILSAGSNGLIDTPLSASEPHGDDVGTRIW